MRVKMPKDLDNIQAKQIGPFTWRQLIGLGVGGATIYCIWAGLKNFITGDVCLILCIIAAIPFLAIGFLPTSDNGITFPEAPAKEGYAFQGWRVNGGSELYNAGDVVVKDGSEEIHLQPVYEATTSAKADDNGASATEEEPDILSEYEDGSDIVLQYGHDNILTLPDAKEKEGYKFYGWSLNGDTDLYDSGSTVPIKAGEKVTLRPVYVSTEEADAFSHKCLIAAGVCFVALLVLKRKSYSIY